MKFMVGDPVVFCYPKTGEQTYGVIREIRSRDPESYSIDLSPRYSSHSYFEGSDLDHVHYMDEQMRQRQFDLQDI